MEFLGWAPRDRYLAEGLLEYEGNLHSCGHDAKKAFDPLADGWYEADTSVVCQACAAAERLMSDEKEKLEPGTVLRIVDTRPPATA